MIMTLHKLITVLGVFLLIAPASGKTFGEQPREQKIGIAEARGLVYEAVKVHNRGAAVINSPRTFDPDFYFFTATWPNPTGSPIIGYFAVNPWTGDVWNVTSCERVTSRSLEKQCRNIEKRLQLKRDAYVRLRAKKPLCDPD